MGPTLSCQHLPGPAAALTNRPSSAPDGPVPARWPRPPFRAAAALGPAGRWVRAAHTALSGALALGLFLHRTGEPGPPDAQPRRGAAQGPALRRRGSGSGGAGPCRETRAFSGLWALGGCPGAVGRSGPLLLPPPPLLPPRPLSTSSHPVL